MQVASLIGKEKKNKRIWNSNRTAVSPGNPTVHR